MNKKNLKDAENWERIAPDYIKFLKQQKRTLKHLLFGSLFSETISILGDVNGKLILDAGCGEGHLSRILAERGALVEGCDVSKTLIKEADDIENRTKQGIKYFIHNITEPFAKSKLYDVVVANNVIFDIYDYSKVFSNVSGVVKKGGLFIFSIIHPCFNISKSQRYNLRYVGYQGGKISFAITKSYKDHTSYQKDKIANFLIHGEVNHYHRPIESYVRSLTNRGFLINDLREPILKLEQIYYKTDYHHHFLPKFLIISAIKS